MFSCKDLDVEPGATLSDNALRSVELTIAFKRIQCYRCDTASVYRYCVKEIRRHPELKRDETQAEPAPDLIEAWRSVPRYAEIPETVRCRNCGEVLGLCTAALY